jgi:hypothetical protein
VDDDTVGTIMMSLGYVHTKLDLIIDLLDDGEEEEEEEDEADG